jgi:hypothetical protein
MNKAMRAARRATVTAIAVAAMAVGAVAQEKKADEKTTVAGTWDVNLMSHQIGLVLVQDGTKVTGTMMAMGKDIEMEGGFVDGKIRLVGKGASFARQDDPHGGRMPITLTGVMKEDGTMEGEAPGPQGPAKWTAERLKKKP